MKKHDLIMTCLWLLVSAILGVFSAIALVKFLIGIA
jgi:hypothetical protein